MPKYIFKTNATMKDYNRRKWWIDPKYIKDMTIEAENLDEAIERYRNEVVKNNFTTISDNAVRTKSPMYIDTKDGPKQVGYVFTGKTDFDNDYGKYVAQYINLWVTILTIVDTEF